MDILWPDRLLYAGGKNMDATKGRHAIKGCGIVLCILFFTLPLVECSVDSSLNASGWELASGTGNLLGGVGGNGFPAVFLLIIIPIVLLILAFLNKPFAMLTYVSIAGLTAKVVFIIGAYINLNSGDFAGAFQVTAFAWFVLALYIGLCVFTYYCKRLE